MATWEIGDIDNSPIGQTTPAAGAFTALKASTDPVDEHGVGDRGFNDLRYAGVGGGAKADALQAEFKEANISAISKGQICAFYGSSGATFEVQLCDCDNVDAIRVIGFALADIAQNGAGIVVYKGFAPNIDTRTTNTDVNPNAETWAAGDMLYVSQTAGGLTNVRPTSGRCIKAGRSLKGSSNTDTLLAIVHTNSICACAAAGEDVCSRLGDSAGVNKHSWKDYSNAEIAALDSSGNLTLDGTVDGREISTDGLKLDGVESAADVTDASNVTAAGALMKVSSTTVTFNAVAATTLYTVPTGKTFIPVFAIIRAGADAADTDITLGRSTALTDFMGTTQLNNLDASGDQALLMPVPQDPPLKLATYAAAVVFQIDVTVANGGVSNSVDLFGYLI